MRALIARIRELELALTGACHRIESANEALRDERIVDASEYADAAYWVTTKRALLETGVVLPSGNTATPMRSDRLRAACQRLKQWQELPEGDARNGAALDEILDAIVKEVP